MMHILVVAVIILAAIVLCAYLLFRVRRNLRRAASQLDRDWLDIELFMKQQSDDLPRLLQTCRSYMQHPALASVTGARAAWQKAASMREKSAAYGQIAAALRALFDAAGASDGLKSNSAYLQLQGRLSELEEKIEARRDLYNDDVARWNARLARFPGSLFAGKGNLKPRPPAAT